ncbi:hypothetical protein KIMH_05730 [Bombiscardovia apis]|uniref:Organic solvents resistance ABC transporter permease n=1 Tax=Bombiscardovia apis TaxID=2932182 RepID=A0ABM8BC84_9BIFI|nr:DUF5719 family protein [Bombiscardovia apis]BDR54462.1 hypothetical protein KIMH_05730 [Bombiscardovia apis]
MSKNKQGLESKSTQSRWWQMLTGALTALIIIALSVAVMVFKPLSSTIDVGHLQDTGVRNVSQLNSTAYCPGRMALADTTAFGEVKPSEGNIASASRFVAFGPVYSSTVSALSGSGREQLADHDLDDDEPVQAWSGSADKGASLHRTQLLQAAQGAGAAGSVVSWASQGDLKGVQAASCLTASFEHSFLLPSTQQGWSQQLVVYNASTKATSVNIEAYGSKESGKLALATSGGMVVKATSEATFDIAAAAPEQDGILVRVSGTDAPVAAMVRVSAMAGTQSKGSDFAMNAGKSARHVALAGLEAGDQTRVLLAGQSKGKVRVSWAKPDGLHEAQTVNIDSQKVVSVDLGVAPDDVAGLQIEADTAVYAAAQATRSGDEDQADFAFITAVPATKVSAMVLPEHSVGRILLMNPGKSEARAHLYGFDGEGRYAANRQVDIQPGEGIGLDLDEIGKNVAIVRLEDDSKQLVWNMRVGTPDVSEANVAGLALLQPTSLMPQTLTVRAQPTQGLVQ